MQDTVMRALADPARLAALRRTALLDTPVERTFDRMCRLAQRLLGVPVLGMGLLDIDREWFKSSIGLPEPWASTRTLPLTHSFCKYVVASGEPLVTSDARQDPRLQQNLAIPDLNVVAYAGFPLKTADGYVLGTFFAIDSQPRVWRPADLAVMADIRDWVVTEIELRTTVRTLSDERQRVLLLLNSVSEGIMGVDADDRCTFINPAGASLLGYEPADLIGKRLHSLIHGKRPDGSPYPAEECCITRSFALQTPQRVDDEVFWRADGHPVAVEYNAVPTRLDGQAVGAVVTFVDISERLKVAAQRNELRSLREADLMKNQFLGILTHELRTPLTILKGYLSILQQDISGAVAPEQRTYVDRSLRVLGHMESLTSDLVDMSQIVAGKFRIHTRNVDLLPLVGQVFEQLETLASPKRLHFLNRVPKHLPMVHADLSRIRQVLSNLVDNAIKYSPPGASIEIRGRVVDGGLRYEVQDHGPGIPAAKQALLFRPFTQLDMSASRPAEGLGLGLSICREIIHAHKGTIGVTSREGAGSTFWFTLPLARAAEEPATLAAA